VRLAAFRLAFHAACTFLTAQPDSLDEQDQKLRTVEAAASSLAVAIHEAAPLLEPGQTAAQCPELAAAAAVEAVRRGRQTFSVWSSTLSGGASPGSAVSSVDVSSTARRMACTSGYTLMCSRLGLRQDQTATRRDEVSGTLVHRC
jgi:hypothetical protein